MELTRLQELQTMPQLEERTQHEVAQCNTRLGQYKGTERSVLSWFYTVVTSELCVCSTYSSAFHWLSVVCTCATVSLVAETLDCNCTSITQPKLSDVT